MNEHLDTEVQERVRSLEESKAIDWGGKVVDGTPAVTKIFDCQTFEDKTVVESGKDAIDAFKKYTKYFDWIMENWTPSSNRAVILPCGSQKPIGTSSIHARKVSALRQAGYLDCSDLIIMSEPCTIIPHSMRLTLPAVNYDFPPQFTEEADFKEVFDIFVERLVRWLEMCEYDVIYPYLVERHMNKFSKAARQADINADIYEVPGWSYNPNTKNHSGDLFKKTGEVTEKLVAVRQLKEGKKYYMNDSIRSECREFYKQNF